MNTHFDLSEYGIEPEQVFRNVSPSFLYEQALKFDKGSRISATGALISYSGEKTGRSPKDKRIVKEQSSEGNVWWGDVNMPLDEEHYLINRERAIDYLNTRERIYVVDGFAGWDKKRQLKVRVICSRPYHALFMHNMLIRPTAEELESFGKPDFVIFNSGAFPANSKTLGMTSKTSVSVSFERNELVILGTEYAGEMKKGVFTVMNYLMPKENILSMHCSVNEGEKGDSSIFFGLSGTGKTTLSADPNRNLIGDDEHCWSDEGLFNIEGGCYAKCIDLSAEKEPEIFNAIRFGALLENVVVNPDNQKVDYTDTSITQNTRCSYPLEHMERVKIPSVTGHPDHIIFLTADAFGVLPPVAKLDPQQVREYFICGYTSKLAGTEMGVKEPEATFSPCYGAAFMVWHPTKYADMLVERMNQHNCDAWLINTGWTGGAYGVGHRMELKHTRAIIDALHNGLMEEAEYEKDEIFNLAIPKEIPNVPTQVLNPRNAWADKTKYDEVAKKLKGDFDNFYKKFH